ncbi:MAG: SPOR domain-containing protein [Hyphomicrobiaceae bacterium]
MASVRPAHAQSGWHTTTTPAGQASARSKHKSQASKRRTSKKQVQKKQKAVDAGRKSAGIGDGAKLSAAAAQQKVEAGIRAIGAGKHTAAVTDISAALDAGSLAPSQTARALYYRGVAYRSLSKPALAIADLTSALWLKKGLDPEQRKDALEQRTAAYREAGIPEQAAPGVATRTADAKQAVSSAKNSTQITGGGTGIGHLLSSWMGGGSTATSSIAKSSPAPESKPAAVAPVASSWGAGTTVVMPAKTTQAAQARPATGRLYGIQVAAVRSPQEAQAVAARVQQRLGAQLNGRAPLVEQTDAGNEGTLYKVRVGPFASSNESRALCDRIKSEGMSCVVVPQ